MEEISYFMVGMPSGGKTSYIIRLCSQIIREKNTVYRLADGRLPEGLSNIEEQMDKMDSFQKIMRTFENVCYEVRLPLVNEEGERILIRIPDLSGEHYRKLVEERYIAKNIYEGLQQSDEILFFINTETMEKEERLNYDEMSAARMIEESFREEEGNDGLPALKEEVPEKPTQSQVTELLQIILSIVKKKVSMKFIMSAWDRVEKRFMGERILPAEYLKRELPLLYQYMISNRDRLSFEVFGVSAQGAEYADEEELEQLEKENVDIDTLVKVIMPDGTECPDISSVLRKQEQIKYE